MKTLLKLAILLCAISASAATYPNRWTTNSDPTSINGSTLTNVPGAQVTYATNANAVTVDFTLPYSLLSTNAAFTFLTPSGVDTTKLLTQTAVIIVTNTTAAAIAVTMPANVHSQGTLFVTNATTFTFFQYAQKFTNCVALPLW